MFGYDGEGALRRSLDQKGASRRSLLRGAAAGGAGVAGAAAVGTGLDVPAAARGGRDGGHGGHGKRRVPLDRISVQLSTRRDVMDGEPGVDVLLSRLAQ